MERKSGEKISVAVKSYLKRRNYSTEMHPRSISERQTVREALVRSEVGRSHSIAFTSVTSDPQDIEETFTKFVHWITDLSSRRREHNDLKTLIAPLFCHFFIELQEKAHKDKQSAVKFFKVHKTIVEQCNPDEIIGTLLEIWQEDGNDLTNIKKTFRENKYCVRLCPSSVSALKCYLSENSHVILLQLIHTWFNIREELIECESDDSGATSDVEYDSNSALLKDVTDLLRGTVPMIFTTHLSNVKDDVTAGCIQRQLGIAAYSYNNMISITSLVTLKQLPNLDEIGDVVIYEHSSRIYDMQISGHHLITASNDCTIKLFDLSDYELKGSYTGHVYPVFCVSPSPNGALFVSGSYDYTCRLWSYENTNTLRLYAGHTQEVTAVGFHPNAKYFVSGSGDRTVRMWSIDESCPLRLFPGCEGSVYAVAFSRSGSLLATAGDESTIRIWDIAKSKQILSIPTNHKCITKLKWCLDDNVLCSGTPNGCIQFWNTEHCLEEQVKGVLIGSEQMRGKLLHLQLFGETINCLTAESDASTEAASSSQVIV